MPRIPRILIKDDSAVYHIISRTALPGYVLQSAEKEKMVKIIKHLSSVYFVDVFGFSVMGNHFHLLLKMKQENTFSDSEVSSRYQLYFGKKKKMMDGQIPFYRSKWSNLSEYVKEIKQTFSRYYNRAYKRKGFFWGERFKSVVIENGSTLVNCLAYIDLNSVRAGIVKRPEEYRWSSVGYHVQTGNKNDFLSTDFGLVQFKNKKTSYSEMLKYYRKFLYEKGGFDVKHGAVISEDIINNEQKKQFELTKTDKFRYRSRYFSDSAILGSKEFVSRNYQEFKQYFLSKKEKKPKVISGLDGIFSLKRLSEAI